MKLLKIGLRGKGGSTSRAGNPLKHDPVFIELTSQLDRITLYDTFHRWRAEFLEQLDGFIDENGSEKSEDAYGVFRIKMENLVRALAKIAHYVNDGNLSLQRVSSKAHGALNDGMIACETIATRLKYLAPPSAVDEEALGFTRYHMAAVLIRDSFEQFERLNMCKDILQVLRDKVVDMVAGRHMLAEMDKFRDAIGVFTRLMMDDVGLLPVLQKQRQLKPPSPPKSLMNEIRGDVLKEALLAKNTGRNKVSKQPSGLSLSEQGHSSHISLSSERGSSHKPSSSRRSLEKSSDDSVVTAVSSQGDSEDRAKPELRRTTSMRIRRSKDEDKGALMRSMRVASATAINSKRTEEEPGSRSLARSISLKMIRSSEVVFGEALDGDESGAKQFPERASKTDPSVSKRLPRSNKCFDYLIEERDRKSKQPQPPKEVRSQNESITLEATTKSSETREKPQPSSAVQNGLVKLEVKKQNHSKVKNWGGVRDDDNRSVVSISSKKKAKLKAKQARKVKLYGKSIVGDKRNLQQRKNRQSSDARKEDVDDILEIGYSRQRGDDQIISPIETTEETLDATAHLDENNLPSGSPTRFRNISKRPNGPTIDRNAIPTQAETSENNRQKAKSIQPDQHAETGELFRKKQDRSVLSVDEDSRERKKPSMLDDSAKRSNRLINKPSRKPKSELDPVIPKYRYNSSGIDKHKRVMKWNQHHVEPETSQKVEKVKPMKDSAKIKIQWPPSKQNIVGTTRISSMASEQRLRRRSDHNRDGHKKSPIGKNSDTSTHQSEGNSRRKPMNKSLPSLLDDCSSVDPEKDEDLGIFDILSGSSHSESSDFERRRTMFENLANQSALSLDLRRIEDDDHEDIDPLDLLIGVDKPESQVDSNTLSVGLVSERRFLFEKPGPSLGSLDDSNHDEEDKPGATNGRTGEISPVDPSDNILKPLNSRGNIDERKAFFEKSLNSLSFSVSFGECEKGCPDNSYPTPDSRKSRKSITELAMSRTDCAMFFDGNASDEFSPGRKSFTNESRRKIGQNPWVHQTSKEVGPVLKPDDLEIETQSKPNPCRFPSLDGGEKVVRALEKGDGERQQGVKKLAKCFEDYKKKETFSESQEKTETPSLCTNSKLIIKDRNHQNTAVEFVADITVSDDQDNTLNEGDVPTRMPRDRQTDTSHVVSSRRTEMLAKKWIERQNQPWNNGSNLTTAQQNRKITREQLSLEESLHDGACRETSSILEKVGGEDKSGREIDELDGKSHLTPEEKGFIAASEVMKQRVEEEARKKAWDQVRQEDERRALEEAVRVAEEDALRMVEEIARMETRGARQEQGNLEDSAQTHSQVVLLPKHHRPTKTRQTHTEDSGDRNSIEESSLYSSSDHFSEAPSWRSTARGSPGNSIQHQLYDKPESSGRNPFFSGRDHLSGTQPWRSKAWGSPLDGTQSQVFDKPPSSGAARKAVFTKQNNVVKNRSNFSEGRGASLKCFDGDELGKSKDYGAPKMQFKPVASWASLDDDEKSHPVKKLRDKKIRSAVAPKKPMKPRRERTKPQITDDSSVIKVKKANRQKGEVTYTKKVHAATNGNLQKKRLPLSTEVWSAQVQGLVFTMYWFNHRKAME